jgi:hypothetical protein
MFSLKYKSISNLVSAVAEIYKITNLPLIFIVIWQGGPSAKWGILIGS